MEQTPISAPEEVYDTELTPLREIPELSVAQQMVIEGFWKAVEELRG